MSAVLKYHDFSMPNGPIEGPSAWYGPDMAAKEDWSRRFSDVERSTSEKRRDQSSFAAISGPYHADGPSIGPLGIEKSWYFKTADISILLSGEYRLIFRN